MGFKSCVFHFSIEQYGCSERYWLVEAGADLTTARTKAANLLLKRVKFLANGAKVVHAIVSDDSVYRDSLAVPLPKYPVNNGKWNKDFQDDAHPDIRPTSLLVRAWSNTRGTKQAYHGIVPDTEITAPTTRPQLALSDPFEKAVDGFYNQLISDGWGWLGIAPDTINVPTDIVDATLHAPQPGVDIQVAAPPAGLVAGAQCRISGLRHSGLPKLNGIWYVTEVAPGNVFIKDYESVDFGYLSGGKIQARLMTVYPFTTYEISGATSRRRGPGWGKPVGRRRTRASR